jgi:hypothetical protein
MDSAELSALIMSTKLVLNVVVEGASGRPATRCGRCGISSLATDIRLDDNEICNECRRYDEHQDQLKAYFRTRADFQSLFKKDIDSRSREYDCLLLYSGGKDSTYVLYRLIDMGLRVITFTFDNGFISPQALINVRSITEELGVRSVIASHNEMKAVFKESLSRYSTVCKGCFKGLLDLSLAFADENNMNMIVTGLSRGQIVQERLKFFYDRGTFNPDVIEKKLQEGRQIYHAVERFRGLDGRKFLENGSIDRVAMVDYFRYDGVTKAEIYETLKSRSHRWTQPGDTGFCSSNCMINDVGISVHQKEKGFSNYEIPTAWEVRLGHQQRAEALRELAAVTNSSHIDSILRDINYTPRIEDAGLIAYCLPQPGISVSAINRAIRSVLPEGNTIPSVVLFDRSDSRHSDALLAKSATAQGILSAGMPLPSHKIAIFECLPNMQWGVRRFRTSSPLDQRVFGEAFLQVILQHHALRLRIDRRDEGWWCSFPMPASLPLTCIDLTHQPVQTRGALIEKIGARLTQRLIGLVQGATTHFGLFSPDERGGATILAIAHDLALDDFSWAPLLDDISTMYQAIGRGERPPSRSVRREEILTGIPGGIKMGVPRDIGTASEIVFAAALGPAERLLNTIIAELAADIGPDGSRWILVDPGRRISSGGVEWSLVGSYAQMLARPDAERTSADTGPSYCAVLLPSEAPTARSRLFPSGIPFEPLRLAGQATWLVLRDVNDGLVATWSDVLSHQGDQALSRVLREIHGGARGGSASFS